jgi:Cu/Ag efflux protein CusF
MSLVSRGAFVALLLTGAATFAAPPGAPAPAEPTVVNEVAEITATVVDIDLAHGLVALKGPEGNIVVVEVDSSVKRLNEIRTGDKLHVKFSRAIALNVVKADGPLKTTIEAAPTVAKDKGAFPGVTAHQTVTATVRIEAIDIPNRTVAFTGEKNGLQTIVIREPKVLDYLKTLKHGDVVKVVYTEAAAMSITAANTPH